ncbi:hypothetical protein EKO04_005488 [Ascochyta lentis]|uniref:Uncharacterized protein n=1 Tax=Ascochyta lentis TaxID=205686 RepID=A0A8H7J3R9_9PLEO|nr:hypothetical protein EKO04_005488 [Ascochyta lentis]
MNRLATPYFYSSIFLKETDHLPALTYLILTSPTHASLVKSVIVPDTWAKLEEQFTEWSWPKIQNRESVLKEKCAAYATCDEQAREMYEKIESGANEDAILALLLANLPRLQKLNINFGICNEHTDFVALWPTIMHGTRSSNDSSPVAKGNAVVDMPQAVHSTMFLNPVDVMVTGSEDKYPNDPIHFAMFIHMPNLRSIYGWRTGDSESDPDAETNAFARLKPRSCPVEYIELRASKLHMVNLRLLLDATIPGKLKTFNYEVGCTWAWCLTEHPGIMASLQPHHDTLDTLGLSHEYYYPYETDEGFDKPLPCSFIPFVTLKRLKVAPVYVWGHHGFTDKAKLDSPETKEMLWKALPENLEQLWITRAHHQEFRGNDATTRFVPECLLPALDLVVQNKGYAFSKLEQLRIELPPLMWKHEWFDTLESLCKSAARHGIHTTIILFDMCDRWSKLAVELPWGWDEDIDWEPPRYSSNRESAKVWIVAAEQRDLAQALKDLKARFHEEKEKYEEARREIGALGPLCRECIFAPEYSAAAQINVPRLRRFVEERLHTKSCWKGYRDYTSVVT